MDPPVVFATVAWPSPQKLGRTRIFGSWALPPECPDPLPFVPIYRLCYDLYVNYFTLGRTRGSLC